MGIPSKMFNLVHYISFT